MKWKTKWWSREGKKETEECLTVDWVDVKMDQRRWWVMQKSFWNGTCKTALGNTKIYNNNKKKNPRRKQNPWLEFPATRQLLYFSLYQNKTQSEICPLDLKRANNLHGGAQPDCFLKVSFSANKIISAIRQNQTLGQPEKASKGHILKTIRDYLHMNVFLSFKLFSCKFYQNTKQKKNVFTKNTEKKKQIQASWNVHHTWIDADGVRRHF